VRRPAGAAAAGAAARAPAWRDGAGGRAGARRDLQGEVLRATRRRGGAGVAIGMRHGAALALAPDAAGGGGRRGGAEGGGEELLGCCCGGRRGVEPGEPGVFWIDPRGSCGCSGICRAGSCGLLAELAGGRVHGELVVGFHRHRAHALARVHRGVLVIGDAAEETALAAQVPLARLDLPPGLLDSLGQLGIHHLGGFLSLPAEELRARFGAGGGELHARSRASRGGAAADAAARAGVRERSSSSRPTITASGCCSRCVPLLDKVLARLAAEGEALAGAAGGDGARHHAPPLRTRSSRRRRSATPGGARQLVELLRLRLGAISSWRRRCSG
jgi:hypothetical protein